MGICGKGEPGRCAATASGALYDGTAGCLKGSTFYSHLLPSLEIGSWRKNRVAGDGWMAVGDAAGLVDPITGEGLYYAIRSRGPGGARAAFGSERAGGKSLRTIRWLLVRDFTADLEFGARLAQKDLPRQVSCSTACPRAWCSSRDEARAFRP